MARQFNTKRPERKVGSREKRNIRGLAQDQQILLGAMVAYSIARDCGMYFSPPATTGSIRVNFYPGDDKCSGSLHLLDDWRQEVPKLMSDVFEEDISLSMMEAALPWLAERLSEAPESEKPTLRTREPVDIPQKGS